MRDHSGFPSMDSTMQGRPGNGLDSNGFYGSGSQLGRLSVGGNGLTSRMDGSSAVLT